MVCTAASSMPTGWLGRSNFSNVVAVLSAGLPSARAAGMWRCCCTQQQRAGAVPRAAALATPARWTVAPSPRNQSHHSLKLRSSRHVVMQAYQFPRGPSVPDRTIAALPYLLPLLDALPFGVFNIACLKPTVMPRQRGGA